MTTSQVAIIFPAVLFWIMLTVQYGLWYHAKQVADTAAAEALDAAKIPTATALDGENAARSFLTTSGNLRDATVHVDRGLTAVDVEIRGHAPQLVPGITWSVTSRAQAPLEQFIPEHAR
jgi:hypothetical protein